MKIIKSIIVAFSMYSKIPMPPFKWESEDMKYHLIFFPWVGAVIALAEYLWLYLYDRFEFGRILFVCIALVLPLLITGGFHFDGFMDTCDAIHSYGSREKKLEILKDPHIGAFSIICTVIYYLLVYGFLSEINDNQGYISLMFSFVLSRIVSGICGLILPKARKNGMLNVEADTAGRKVTIVMLTLEFAVSTALMILITGLYGVLILVSVVVATVYLCILAKKEFGGITGDLAGFFVCISELLSVILVGIFCCAKGFY